mmetsp:Transcript_20730/g.29792  ORF Transcript_20730/g.29792 Transcript_20730/m.29792 type:complete len:257 (+) Transcript_20730:1027-1797(+)
MSFLVEEHLETIRSQMMRMTMPIQPGILTRADCRVVAMWTRRSCLLLVEGYEIAMRRKMTSPVTMIPQMNKGCAEAGELQRVSDFSFGRMKDRCTCGVGWLACCGLNQLHGSRSEPLSRITADAKDRKSPVVLRIRLRVRQSRRYTKLKRTYPHLKFPRISSTFLGTELQRTLCGTMTYRLRRISRLYPSRSQCTHQRNYLFLHLVHRETISLALPPNRLISALLHVCPGGYQASLIYLQERLKMLKGWENVAKFS